MSQAKNTLLPKDFGERLRWFRNERGISQADLGKPVNRTPTSISEWEKGESEPTLDQIAKLAEKLGVSAAHLAYGEFEVQEVHAPYYVKTRSLQTSEPAKGGASSHVVAFRTEKTERTPSTRADCEAYVAELFERAAVSGNPNAFPVIADRLAKRLPLDEWEPAKEET